MELAEFLLARIAEDEEVARAASPGPWHLNAESDEVLAVDDITVCDGFALSGPQTRATTAHIARWDPARVLAECEAKRRIVGLHEMVTEDYAGKWWTDPKPPGAYVVTGCDHCRSAGSDGEEYVVDGPCPTLRLLALPYADHPDYREDWRP